MQFYLSIYIYIYIYEGTAIPVRGRRGAYGCETSRFPHFLDNRVTDGGQVVSLTRRPPFSPRKFLGTHFCQRMSQPQGHIAAGRIRSIEKFNNIGIRTLDLPGCSIMPQPSTLLRTPLVYVPTIINKLMFIT
jgi:hypothetical protein